MRIAIVTFHRAFNCGAMLQAWALKVILERMGHMVEFPSCNHVGEIARWKVGWKKPGSRGLSLLRSVIGRSLLNLMSIPNEDISRMRYDAFRRMYLPERDCKPSDFDKYYDLIIVGSDQVWNEKISEADAPLFFGENLPQRISRIAYAVSCGDKPVEGEMIKRIGCAMKHFSAISAREKLTKDQLSALVNEEIEETLDPTLLLEAIDYEEIAQGVIPRKPYLFMYTLSTNKFFVDVARGLSRRLGVRCIIAPCYQYSRFLAPCGLTYGISPGRLVQYARNAKYVIAASFHGTAMGVIFNKPFLSLRGQVDEFESRPAALLRKLGCSERLVDPTIQLDEMLYRLLSPLPDIRNQIRLLRNDSLRWLDDKIRLLGKNR